MPAAAQRGGTSDGIVAQDVGTVLGDAVLDVGYVVPEAARGVAANDADGATFIGLIARKRGVAHADLAARDKQRATFVGLVVRERRVVHPKLAARNQQRSAALRFVLFERGGVHGDITATHFDGAARQSFEDGVRDHHRAARDRQRPHGRAGLEPAPHVEPRACAVKAAACDLDRAALDHHLPVERQPVQLHRGGTRAYLEQGGGAAREECVFGCGDLESAKREVPVQHHAAQDVLARGKLKFKLFALEWPGYA
eukprot:scaffold1338_cov63-Phaeocystis_antarctica.AAC.12